MKYRKEGILTLANAAETVAADSRAALLKAGFSESEADRFAAQATGILKDYAVELDVDTRVEYVILRRLGKMELRMLIPGEAFDPFTDGKDAKKRSFEKLYSLNPEYGNSEISYKYAMRCNIVSVSVPLTQKEKKLIKDPVLWGKIRPVAGVSFTTASTTAALSSACEASEKLRIRPSFTSFWIPMASAMLSPKTAVNVVIATFMAAQLRLGLRHFH